MSFILLVVLFIGSADGNAHYVRVDAQVTQCFHPMCEAPKPPQIVEAPKPKPQIVAAPKPKITSKPLCAKPYEGPPLPVRRVHH